MLLSRALRTSPTSAGSFSDRSAVSRRTYSRTLTAVACLAATALLSSAAARAATINYGNFNAPPVSFLQVTESSGTDPVPLFGPPSPYPVGLDFNPTFTSNASAGSADITDGQLNFTISSAPGIGITGLNLFEAGDYTLAGGGGPPTSVTAGVILRATITQINGLPVAPINLPPVNASFSDALPGPAVAAPWSLGLFNNIAAALQPGQNATRVDIAINNTLVTTSEPNSIAFIAKKEFQIGITTNIPEPATLAMVGLAGVGLVAARRRRSEILA